MLRFGKSLDFIQGALKSLHLKDDVLRLSITLSKINQAFYLLFDHFLWFHNVGAVKMDKQYWSEVSSRFYLAGLLLNLVRDFYGIYCVVNEELKRAAEANAKQNGDGYQKSANKKKVNLLEVLKMNIPLLLETTKNIFDLSIPIGALQMMKLSPQQQGVCGMISSVIAIMTIWNPNLKLVPS